MTKHTDITVFASANDLFQFAANDFASRAITAVQEKELFSVVLAGGNTPKLFFDLLTSDDSYKNIIPWQQIQFFFGDERYVAADDSNSNYHMAQTHLFSKLSVKPDNIYRIPTEYNDPTDAAKQYETTLRQVFQLKENAFPPFDLIYLGLGDNAHTASLMPFSDPVKYAVENSLPEKNNPLVASLFVPALNKYRITLTPIAINHGLNRIFLVTGADKAMAVWNVLEGPHDPLQYPAQLIHCVDGKTKWYLDHAAAEKLSVTDNHYGK